MSQLWNPPATTCAYLASGIGEVSCVEVLKVLVEGRSRYQQYAILDTVPYGRILVLDNVIQSSAFDEWTYHEAFVIPALCVVPVPRRVLILGGGEGAMARETLRHPTVETVTMVDIDEEVVAACQRWLPEQHAGCFADPRLTVVHEDARQWLAGHAPAESFDAVLVDLTEPLAGGPSDSLFTKEFYELIRRSLNPTGVMALQAGSVRLNFAWAYAQVIRTLQTVFPHVLPYTVWITSFAEQWGFAVAGGESVGALAGELIDERLAQRGLEPRFLDGLTFEGLRRLPRFIRVELAASTTIATDDRPLRIER